MNLVIAWVLIFCLNFKLRTYGAKENASGHAETPNENYDKQWLHPATDVAEEAHEDEGGKEEHGKEYMKDHNSQKLCCILE